MKYLKRINENNNEDIIEYIEQCFISLLDEGYVFEHVNDEYEFSSILIIEAPEQNRYKVSNSTETANFLLEKSLEIETSIKKVQLKYPDIDFINEITLNGEWPDLHIEIVFEY